MATPGTIPNHSLRQLRHIRLLKALYDNAYETKEIEFPWYLLWTECFKQLNDVYSDDDICLSTGPQYQFTERSQPAEPDIQAELDVQDEPDDSGVEAEPVPRPRSPVITRQSNRTNPVEHQELGEDCPAGDKSFGSHVTHDSEPETTEIIDRYRVPDFTIFRYMLQVPGRPILPTGIVENKPLLRPHVLKELVQDDATIHQRDKLVAITTINRTRTQAHQQLECLFAEYPQVPSQPLQEVYLFIIAGGWYWTRKVTRDNLASLLPVQKDASSKDASSKDASSKDASSKNVSSEDASRDLPMEDATNDFFMEDANGDLVMRDASGELEGGESDLEGGELGIGVGGALVIQPEFIFNERWDDLNPKLVAFWPKLRQE